MPLVIGHEQDMFLSKVERKRTKTVNDYIYDSSLES